MPSSDLDFQANCTNRPFMGGFITVTLRMHTVAFPVLVRFFFSCAHMQNNASAVLYEAQVYGELGDVLYPAQVLTRPQNKIEKPPLFTLRLRKAQLTGKALFKVSVYVDDQDLWFPHVSFQERTVQKHARQVTQPFGTSRCGNQFNVVPVQKGHQAYKLFQINCLGNIIIIIFTDLSASFLATCSFHNSFINQASQLLAKYIFTNSKIFYFPVDLPITSLVL